VSECGHIKDGICSHDSFYSKKRNFGIGKINTNLMLPFHTLTVSTQLPKPSSCLHIAAIFPEQFHSIMALANPQLGSEADETDVPSF